LSGEFERQFFGDVMLFAVIELVKQGYPDIMPAADKIRECVVMTETKLCKQYADNLEHVSVRLAKLEIFLAAPGHWWRSGSRYQQTCTLLDHFAAALRANYSGDDRPNQLIDDAAHRSETRQAIVEALLAYNDDRECWERVLHLSRTSL
jgi:hypothetical protein